MREESTAPPSRELFEAPIAAPYPTDEAAGGVNASGEPVETLAQAVERLV